MVHIKALLPPSLYWPKDWALDGTSWRRHRDPGSFPFWWRQLAGACGATPVALIQPLWLMGTTLLSIAFPGTVLMAVNDILKGPTPDLPLTDLAVLLLNVQKSQLSRKSPIKCTRLNHRCGYFGKLPLRSKSVQSRWSVHGENIPFQLFVFCKMTPCCSLIVQCPWNVDKT